MSDAQGSGGSPTASKRIVKRAPAESPSGSDSLSGSPSRSRRSFTVADVSSPPLANEDSPFRHDRAPSGDEVASSSSPSSRKIAAIKATRLGGRSSSSPKESGSKTPPTSSLDQSLNTLPTIEHVKLEGDRKVVKSATITQLIEEYSENSTDAESIQHLSVAHGHFISNYELLRAIIKQYKSINDQSANFQKQYRVINILKTWLGIDRLCVFSPEFSETLHEFVDYLNQTAPSIGSYFTSAIELRSSSAPSIQDSVVDSIQLGSAALSSKFSSNLPRLTDFSEADIARQLCLIDQSLLKKIPLSEFHKCRWTRNEAPKLETAGSFSNKLSVPRPVISSKFYTFSNSHLSIGYLFKSYPNRRELLQLQNFNCLLAVYLALQNSRIKQMQLEWGSKAKKAVQTLKIIESVMSPVNNFAAYRNHIKELHYPLIPCLEVFLKDLLYQAEGSPDYFEDQRILNILKMDSMGKLIMQAVNAQNVNYEFEHNEALGALFASFLNRSASDLTEELENIIDSSDWNEYLSLSKKDIEALVSKDEPDDSDPEKEKEKKSRDKKADKKRTESLFKEQIAQKDAEIASLKARISELESEVKRLKKGKD